MGIALVVIFLIFVIYCLLCLRPVKAGEDSHSVNAFLPIRGLCALGIIFVHCATQGAGPVYAVVHSIFIAPGSVYVALFLAISGYALSKQYAQKKEGYLKGFLVKRYTSLFLPYIILTLLFLGIFFASDMFVSNLGFIEMVKAMAGRVLDVFREGYTIVPYSWYVKSIAILYLVFYLACLIFKENRIGCYIVVVLSCFAYILVCRVLNYMSYWYVSIFGFLAGMIWYDLFEKGGLKENKIVCLITFIIMLAIYFVIEYVQLPYNQLLELGLREVQNFVIPFALFIFLCFFRYKSKILEYLGSRSYEIYLCHGIPRTILIGILDLEDNVLMLFIVLASSILLAEGLYRLDRWIIAKIKNKKDKNADSGENIVEDKEVVQVENN